MHGDETDDLVSLQTPEDLNHSRVSVSGHQGFSRLIKEKGSRVSGTVFRYPGKPLPTLFFVVIIKNCHTIPGSSSSGPEEK